MRAILAAVVGATLIVSMPAAAAAQAQPAAAGQPDDPAKLAEARAIVQIVSPPAEREKTLSALLPKIEAQMRTPLPPAVEADPGLKAVIEGGYKDFMGLAQQVLLKHMPDMMEATAVAYTHEFSLAELRQIHAFADTEAGHHYLSRAASVLGDPAVAKANSAMIADLHQLLATKKAELKDKFAAYLEAHPDVAKKVADADAAAEEKSK